MSAADPLWRASAPAAPAQPQAPTDERTAEWISPAEEHHAWRVRALVAARWRWGLAVAVVLAGSLALRLWGIRQGLPFAYNADENVHFVPHALGFFNTGDLNPHYFNNPPAYTYLLWVVYAVWFGGGRAVSHTMASNPTEVFEVARVTTAILGTIACWLLYHAGARLLDRRVGLVAAALLGVAFLPVFYSHLALNDVPALAPIALSLWGTARVLRTGRTRDYLIAGLGLGLACSTKYTGGIVVLPLVAAAAVQFLAPGGRRPALIGLGLAAAVALGAFVATNPYALTDFHSFRAGLNHQSSVADETAGKLGQTHHRGWAYYLWSLTWGLGWVPAIAALVGLVLLWFDERRLLVVLAPAPIVFLIFMSSQGRYFGRWLIPILPIVCVLAAYAVVDLADRLSFRRPVLRPGLLAVGAVALGVQALVHSIHSGLVQSRPDTRNLTRDWMVAHVAPGSKIVVEPVVPDAWVQDVGRPYPFTASGGRWTKSPALKTHIDAAGKVALKAGTAVNIEDYERTLRPQLISAYELAGYCWVVTGSTQAGRAAVAPRQVPQAVAYYQRLARAQLVYQSSPYGAHQRPVPFNFDWSFDFYPLAYHRPGPLMRVYHLQGGACAG